MCRTPRLWWLQLRQRAQRMSLQEKSFSVRASTVFDSCAFGTHISPYNYAFFLSEHAAKKPTHDCYIYERGVADTKQNLKMLQLSTKAKKTIFPFPWRKRAGVDCMGVKGMQTDYHIGEARMHTQTRKLGQRAPS